MNRQQIPIDKLAWLSLCILLAGLPHWERLPIWIPVIHVLLILARLYLPWRHANAWQHQQMSINILRLVIMVGGTIGVYSTYGTFAGRDVGITLLVMLSALKVFESKTARDYYICAYLGYFLVITNFFYLQTIPTAVYMFVVVTMMTASLIGYNDRDEQLGFFKKLRLASSMMLQSIPLLLILFVLFPRVNGPLWGLPEDAFTAVTGIDDQIEPGSISKLVKSQEIAFRVKFDGDIPDPAKLYWRGPVLWQTDGRIWTRGAGSGGGTPAPIEYYGDAINYNLMLEPTNKKWIFALEMNSDTPVDTYLTGDHQLKAKETLQSRKAYNLTAYSDYRLDKATNDNLLRALALPEYHHEQTRQLGSELKQRFGQPEDIVNGALDWITRNNFIYTLTPPLTAGDTVDDFLFNSRQGFCEHYAAAFTILMRSAGVPARIVAGYQGGEINPLGNYLVVRQYHAHAWTEVWLEEQGWVRVDPTHVVSPTRIDQGMEGALPDAVVEIPAGFKNSSALTQFWQSLQNSIEMINYQWAQWVLGYGPERQQMLMQMLGLGFVDWKKLTVFLFTTIGIAIVILSVYVFSRRQEASDPARKYYDRFCRKLARVNLARLHNEGPEDYARRIVEQRHDMTEEVKNITRLYIDVRYCSRDDELAKLKDAIQHFKPPRQRTANQ